MMLTHVLSPVGARVTGLDLTDPGSPSDSEVAQLVALLAERGVVVLPDQHIDDVAFTSFLRRLGDPVFTQGETPVPGFPDLNVISNEGRSTPPRSTFHVDTSYVAAPPAYTALRAVTIPSLGGQTLFTNQYRALETLPADVRDDLEGREITHVVTGVELGPEDEAAATHPIVRRHPVCGRDSLYLSTPARCAAVSGLDEDAGRALVAFLHTHSTRDDNTYRHSWSPGDVVVWDNGCVLHKADHSGVVGSRVMHRGMAAGYADAGAR